ncbi:DNA cytosine methyltransferase [Herbiconiux sp. VKM Ac-2851]|uniref:DNA cytosine methyltransferase n=1 Tax=Herbiconiux sp. VKM Ac-2851 TaxID=2739025 RepID=UPI0020B113EE|nr:DNA cytosine methyltransferase [Herbiconiux sp. VKM Ac-2851]
MSRPGYFVCAEPEAVSRTLDLCAGPGGWDEGARSLGLNLDISGFDLSPNACATASAAGHRRSVADIRALDIADFSEVTGAIMSPPCPTFSKGGLRTGLGRDYQRVLDVWTSIGWGIDPEEAIEEVDAVEDERTALLALAGLWALGLPNLEWLAMEQVPAVEFAWEDLAAELFATDWEWVDVMTIDAADYGVPSRRRRSFLVAHRTMPGAPWSLPEKQTSMAEALGWAPGHRVNTRGNRNSAGGNEFSADKPSWCLTGSTRTWARDDGLRLTPAEAGTLVGFRPDYPWHGSRSAAFLQAADVVSPPIAAGVLARIPGLATAGLPFDFTEMAAA